MSDMRDTVARLRGVADAKPELSPIVETALTVVKAAQDEVAAAEKRARLAEEVAAGVRPHIDAVCRRNQELEERLRVRDERDAAAGERVRVERRAVERDDLLRDLAAAVSKLAEQTRDLPRAPEFQLLAAVHRCTRDQDGRSAIRNRAEYRGGPWDVIDVDGAVIAVLEKRSDAIALVKSLLDEEIAAAAKGVGAGGGPESEDSLDSPRTRRRRQPGEVPADPADGGPVPGAAPGVDGMTAEEVEAMGGAPPRHELGRPRGKRPAPQRPAEDVIPGYSSKRRLTTKRQARLL